MRPLRDDSAESHAAATNARPIAIEAVTPQIDGGSFAVKRTQGERLAVEADIFRDGHAAITAVLRLRECGASVWEERPMRPGDNDRWSGSFPLGRLGRYEYTIQAWPDDFGSWQGDASTKRAAGQAGPADVAEGTDLLHAARARAQGAARDRLDRLCSALDAAGPDGALEALLSADAAEAAASAPDRSRATVSAPALPLIVDRAAARFGAWYEFFPRSQGRVPGEHGTFADAAARLPDVRAMGFDVLYLPPIHPIGRTHRKGRNNALEAQPGDPGSPWAIGNEHGGHTAIEPALGTLADFERFVGAARELGLEIALDYALQCSPDHPYLREHPEWFSFRADGSLRYAENPPKTYEDIVNFNWYGPHAPALWRELRDVVLFWIARGVRIFRVDNPHTKPFDFWEWMIADVQARRPDVIFLAEAFTRPKVMRRLAKLGFTQSYTYFTWRTAKGELAAYASELAHGESAQYLRPNFFTNTPDILPPFLQSGERAAFRIRLFLAATLSSVYGIYSGFELCEHAALPHSEEYADSEKYQIAVRDWDAPGNIKDDIARINRLRHEHPALQDWRNLRFLRADDENVLFYAKTDAASVLLIAVNLDPFATHECRVHVPFAELGLDASAELECAELLGGARYAWRDGEQTVRLDPAFEPAAIYRIARPGSTVPEDGA